MNLRQLQTAVNNAIEHANECGEPIDNIVVSLQIDGPDDKSVWAIDGVGLYYDNNLQAAGCVLQGVIDAS